MTGRKENYFPYSWSNQRRSFVSTIRNTYLNKKKKQLSVELASGKVLNLPLAKLKRGSAEMPERIFVDPEMGLKGVTCLFKSGREESIPLDAFYDYNRDPDYLKSILLYKMTLEAISRLKILSISKNELTRRLGTSPSQLSRLLDPKNKSKSIDHMLRLLTVLGCDVEFKVKKSA
jgi:hypothetical protein